MKAWSPDWYHWLRLVVAESEAYELVHAVPVHFLAVFFTRFASWDVDCGHTGITADLVGPVKDGRGADCAVRHGGRR